MVYEYKNNTVSNSPSLLDSVSIDKNKIALNVLYKNLLNNGEFNSDEESSTEPTDQYISSTFFAIIPKQPLTSTIEINKIDTLNKFEKYKPNINLKDYKTKKYDKFEKF